MSKDTFKALTIADPKVLAIPIEECHEALIDLKNLKDLKDLEDQKILLFGPVPECEATASCYTKMRKTVYEKLCRVQKALPKNWRIRLYEGYRSLEVQQILFDWVSAKIDLEFPNLGSIERFQKITQLVSPLKTLEGKENIPVHNTGAAIDLEIIDEESGNLIDMGMAVKDWIAVSPEICLTDSALVSLQAKNHRQILLKAMEDQGFVNYPYEWWHFSYGDRYWALLKGEKFARYGAI
jgi:D-alanyl-D-alanine dipeptidase